MTSESYATLHIESLTETRLAHLALYLIHGRKDPNDTPEDWGFDGPTLDGVTGLHQTYNNPPHVVFASVKHAVDAHDKTGWPFLDSNVLQMVKHEDLVVADKDYFGDWGILLGGKVFRSRGNWFAEMRSQSVND